MNFCLVELRSFNKNSSGFMLPVFSTQHSNQSFVQNLDVSGNVEEFFPLTMDLKKSDILPPIIEISIGDKGIIAFIDENKNSYIGNILDIREKLKSIEIKNPLLKLELSSFLENSKMFQSALTECSFLFTDSSRFQSWEKREKDTFKSVIALRNAPNPEKDNRDVNFRFADEMAILREDMKHEKWANIWSRVWNQSYRRRELIGLAALRRDRNLDLEENDGNVFLLALDEDKSDFIVNRSIDWLNSVQITSQTWINLYYKIYSNIYKRTENFVEIGVSALKNTLKQHKPISQSTVRFFRFIATREYRSRQQVIDIGMEILTRSNGSTDVVKYVAYPLIRDKDAFRTFREHTRYWVMNSFASSIMWASLFLKLAEDDFDPDLRDRGIEWLRLAGGNTTIWYDVWHTYDKYISEEQRIELALNWLKRARWDMKAWVKVYSEVFSSSLDHDYRHDLIAIGERWLNGGYGSRKVRTDVRKFVDYMKNLPTSD